MYYSLLSLKMISFVLYPQASQPSTNFYNIGIGLFIPSSFLIILSLLVLIIFVVFPSPLPPQFYCFPSPPPPPPPHFYFVPPSYYQLVHFVALSHVVKNSSLSFGSLTDRHSTTCITASLIQCTLGRHSHPRIK